MKNGIDYFSFDVQLDDKFELIEAEFGLTGFAVVVKLFQKIYGGQGYYCEWTNDVALLFSKKIGRELGGNVVSEIVNASIKRGIFDKEMYEKYQILTSAGVQKRYFSAVSRRKQINVKNEYLLVKVTHFSDDVNILSENVCNFGENADNFKQRKEEKSKEKKSKLKKRKEAGSGAYARVISLLENAVGTLSERACEEVSMWIEECDVSVIEYAIEQASLNNKRSFGYIRAIVNRCIAERRTTRSDCENAPKARTDTSQYKMDDMAAIERKQRLEKMRKEQHR